MVPAILLLVACGRKGPPLPPLLKLPAPPAEMKADRHGGQVDVEFNVPMTNTDGTRPANINRIDVYALTATRAVGEADVIKFGSRIARLGVKAPRDPNQVLEPDEEEDVELDGKGLDPGIRAKVEDTLTPEAHQPVDVTKLRKGEKPKTPAAPLSTEGPLLSPVMAFATRVYVAVSVTTKGKNSSSAHAVVSMIDAPAAVEAPKVVYTEKAVTVSWTPIQPGASSDPAPDDVLPSTPIGAAVARVAYNVYEASDATPPSLNRLTPQPTAKTSFTDPRITWGDHRCYAVRAFVTIEDTSVEGIESPATCVTLTDTFAPAAPQGVQAIPSDGAISLIWEANPESDIRGYIVLRGPASADTLEPLTREPVVETSFQDRVQPGVRFAYAIQAVDTAGNVSPPSTRVEETAR